MNIIENIKLKAKEKNKKIILPESMDERVVKAAIIANNDSIANIILIGDKKIIQNNFPTLDINDIEVINPLTYELKDECIRKFYELRKDKGISLEDAKKIIENDYMYFACMLVYLGVGDGIVSGAAHTSSDTLRPALQIIKGKSDEPLVSSFFLMNVLNSEYGLDGVFVFSDCGLIQDPTSEELAYIAYSASKSFELLTGNTSNIALLSHSTFGSAKHPLVDKVVNAKKIIEEKYSYLNVDGELQLDAAIDEKVSMIKSPNSKIKGKANTLIFPNIDAGNIGYKLTQKLAKAEAYGPITQGLNKPVNDLSRGCSVDDIVGVIAITVLQTEA